MDYEKQQKALTAELLKMAKESDSKIVKKAEAEKRFENSDKNQLRERLIRMVCNEAIEMYRGGDTNFKDTITDLKKALDAIS